MERFPWDTRKNKLIKKEYEWMHIYFNLREENFFLVTGVSHSVEWIWQQQ